MTKILSLNASRRHTQAVFNTISSDDMRRFLNQSRIRIARSQVPERIRATLRGVTATAA